MFRRASICAAEQIGTYKEVFSGDFLSISKQRSHNFLSKKKDPLCINVKVKCLVLVILYCLQGVPVGLSFGR
jgi:hypothetical protein